MFLNVEGLTGVGENMTLWRSIQHHGSRLTSGHGMWSPDKEYSPCWKLNSAEPISARHHRINLHS